MGSTSFRTSTQNCERIGIVLWILVGLLVAGWAAEGLLGATPPAAAADREIGGVCPGVITTDARLVANIIASPGPQDPACIIFGANNIKVDLNEFTVDMRGAGPRAAFDTNFKTNVRIEGPGKVLTTYTTATATLATGDPTKARAIHVRGGGNVRVRDVIVRNAVGDAMTDPSGTMCVPSMSRVGEGVLVGGAIVFPATTTAESVNGAKVHDNVVECYAIGVNVLNSTPGPSGGADMIGHNTIQDNTSLAARSVGLLMQNADSWVVNHNTLTRNGFATGDGSESGITFSDGSSNNQVVGNDADANVGPGIGVSDAASVNNKFVQNHAILNVAGAANELLGDLHDTATPGANFWNKNNVCNFDSGTVPEDVCNPGETN